VDETTMYVSRGLGFEGGGAPRARFLARPEIVVVEVGGAFER
jgi:predicted MPP superfamily phosphohydrolase